VEWNAVSDLQERIKHWWNSNPYTYGLSSRGRYRDVGDVSDRDLDREFFARYMRKVRKHFDDAQRPGQPLASRFIDYESLRDKKVLDIACGFGWATVEMARAGARVTAIDVTPRAIEATRQHLSTEGLRADLHVMDAQQIEFDAGTFDFVLAWGCLMHMPDTAQAMAEVYRVVKPEGSMAGYMYNKNSISYWWNMWFLRGVLLGRLIAYRGDTQRLVSRYTDGETIGGNALTKVYTPEAAAALLQAAGFRQAEVRPWGPPEMIQSFPVRKLPLGRLLPYPVRKSIADRFGWGMVFRAVK
jgi:2-polyprenyl-3-methyl-5-hydroxy-6-metoxy-1,4-benzoquinol methylase